jgi:hypothetical protein
MSNRLDEELDEILKKTQDLPAASKPRKPAKEGGSGSGTLAAGIRRVLSPRVLFITSLALFLSALLLQNVAGGLVGVFFWLGLILFIVAYALFFARPRDTQSQVRWRGKVVEYTPEGGSSLWNRVRGWLKG